MMKEESGNDGSKVPEKVKRDGIQCRAHSRQPLKGLMGSIASTLKL